MIAKRLQIFSDCSKRRMSIRRNPRLAMPRSGTSHQRGAGRAGAGGYRAGSLNRRDFEVASAPLRRDLPGVVSDSKEHAKPH